MLSNIDICVSVHLVRCTPMIRSGRITHTLFVCASTLIRVFCGLYGANTFTPSCLEYLLIIKIIHCLVLHYTITVAISF